MTLADAIGIEQSRERMHAHALTRAYQRHGLILTADDLEVIVAAVRRKGPDVVTLRVEHDTFRRKVAIHRGGAWQVLIYDEIHNAVVTFYPRDSTLPFRRVLEIARYKQKLIERKRHAVEPESEPYTYPESVPIDDGLPPVGTVLGRVELPPETLPCASSPSPSP